MASTSEPSSCITTQTLPLVSARSGSDGDCLAGRFLAGKFRLIEQIGHGAHGAVYRAEQLPLGREVAVKIVRPAWPQTAMTFFEEAYEASRIQHPNVVTIFDFGESDDGILFLAMEHVSGVTLADILDSGAPLPVPRVLSLMLQVAMGLEAVHRAGIVHADLKSANLMVADLPHGELVKLLDFGIARRIEPILACCAASGRASAWSPAAGGARSGDYVCGTPGYIAPEVILGAMPGYASDVYAAGIVLYRLLTGTRPFPGRTGEEIMERQLAVDLDPPSVRRAHVPRALESIVMRASARAPEDRYADAGALRRALEAVAVALIPGMFACGSRQVERVHGMGPCAGAHVA